MWLIVLLASLVVAILLLVKGPTRRVKIALVCLAVVVLIWQAATFGWQQLSVVLVVLAVVHFVSMSVAARLVRQPLHKRLDPVDPTSWPRYAVAMRETWTHDLEQLGFSVHADRLSPWGMGPSTHRSYVRFLRHASGHTWAEIHAIDSPRLMARQLTTVKEGEHAIETCDKQSNEELFDDPLTTVQRLPARTDCASMLHRHEALSMRIPGAPETVDDPPARHAALYDRWIQRLLASGQVVVKGTSAVIPLHRTPITALRVLRAWFQ